LLHHQAAGHGTGPGVVRATHSRPGRHHPSPLAPGRGHERADPFAARVEAVRGHAVKPLHTVLIAEDEANMRRVLSALLERDGYRTLEAPDGAAALELLARESVDAILTDLRMPKLNGLELLEAVRRKHPEIPVIMLTAHGTVGSAVEALKQGAFD